MQPSISQALASQRIADSDREAPINGEALPRPGGTRDTSGVRARVTSSRFVGRAGELAELEHVLREAAEQRPFVVLLGGESGVGKTRLVREFERRLSDRDDVARPPRARQSRRPTASFPTRR